MSTLPRGSAPPAARHTEPSPPTGSTYPWLVVLMLWWISFFNYADRQAVFSVFPLLRGELNLTDAQLGLLGSSFAWVYGLGAPLAGLVVDRVRRKTAILGGLQAWSVICLLTGLAGSFRQLVFFRAAEGLGETFYYPASTSLISDYHGPVTRSRALGIHQTSVYVGTIAGGFFAGLIGQVFGWRWSFVVFGGCGIALGLVLRRFLVEPRRGAAESTAPAPADDGPAAKPSVAETLSTVLRTPTVLVLMAAFACANFVAMVLLSWMPDYVHRQFGLDLALAGLTATMYAQLASMVGAALGGFLADRWRRRRSAGRILVQFVGVLGGAPFVLWCGLTHQLGAFIVALTAWGLFKGLYDANIFAAVFDVVRPEARGSVAGLMNMVGWLFGGASAPLVIGLLAERFDLGPAIASAAAVYLAAGAFLVAASVFVRRDMPSSAGIGPGPR